MYSKRSVNTGWDRVAIRAFSPEDIDAYVNYWHDPSNQFLDDMGIDRSRLPSPIKMREQLALSLESKVTPSSLMTIVYDGTPVGIHELTEMTFGNTGVMHAHVWSDWVRGKGIGRISYIKAMGEYFGRYSLTAIEFRTPKSNVAANRIKQHLGLPVLGETNYFLPIFRQPIPSYLYRVEAEDYDKLAAQAKEAFA